jgi:UDP-N-acetylglucosamine 2-epimerase (non-hydrolysing)
MKVLSSASARPNFVKLAAVDHALKKSGFEHVIVHTGQHYDPMLSDVFFRELSITQPAYNLGVKGGSDRESVIDATMQACLPVLQNEHPDIVLVYGDVNGSVGVARAAQELHLRLGHVEAGLRSFDTEMPEELNRMEIDHIADDLFTTEESATMCLRKEHAPGRVHFVGNTMIDTLIRLLPTISAVPVSFAPKSYVVATIHRPSNTDDPKALRTVFALLQSIPVTVVMPLHPRTKAAMQQHDIKVPASVQLIDPLGYIEFLALCKNALCIVTDSGGIQEEAVLLHKKCFTLRRNTERPSTIDSGSNELIDPASKSDCQRVIDFVQNPFVSIVVPPLWDGETGTRIVDILRTQ